MSVVSDKKYRTEIDGLRAFAVISVVIFHFGYAPNGFLGVDVFFVISGYLITGIIYNKILSDDFSLVSFYVRRIKRIIPLTSFISLTALVLGVIFMLPDDLENLAQSVIATNFFNNNTLQILTTKDYWDVINEFKPLMHTWSLAIEEQFYFIYPFIFLLFSKFSKKTLLIVLALLTIISIFIFLAPFEQYYKFYLLPFRFFELSIGGIFAIVFNGKTIKHKYSFLLVSLLIIILFSQFHMPYENILLLFTVLLTCTLLVTDYSNKGFSSILLKNKVASFIGKISFSIYMWHQLILAFTRYLVVQEVELAGYIFIFILTILLSILTYYFIETPFRYKIPTKQVIFILIFYYVISTGISYKIHSQDGILKDVPELDLFVGINNDSHSNYNHSIYNLDKKFSSNNKIKILVVGNSFARDWCNILLESKFKNSIEVSYIFDPLQNPLFFERSKSADLIFFSTYSMEQFKKLNISLDKVYCLGTKNFGSNSGYFYNYTGDDYCMQRTKINKSYLDLNSKLKDEWQNKFIDLVDLIIDENSTVPIFNENCKFISQDTRHLTKHGAIFYAKIISNDSILKKIILNK